MKARRTVIVGTALIISILALIVTTFFLNQDSCNEGTFKCKNSTYCVPQKSICNGYPDCPNADDESGETCTDIYGSDFIRKLINPVQKLPTDVAISSSYQSCALQNVPEECFCRNKTYIICKNKGLTAIPSGISGNVKRMILANNTIRKLNENSFIHYQNLELIHLEGNGIEYLPARIFQNQIYLIKLLLMNNQLKDLAEEIFNDTNSLSILFIQNNQLRDSALIAFNKASNLMFLDLSHNMLELRSTFPESKTLRELLLENNKIKQISFDTFSRLPKLKFLSLRYNNIRYIHEKAFQRLTDLEELDLSYNLLSTLPELIFFDLKHLKKLFLGHNPFHYVPRHLFQGLVNLSSLNLQDIELTNIDLRMFSTMVELKFVYLKNFFYCTFVSFVPTCEPKTDGVSTSENLLGRPILRVTIWIVAFFTCTANMYVLWGRLTTRDENRVLNWIVRNLAISDLAMGIYLVVIGVKDMQYRGIYHKVAHEWVSSWTCTIVGAIAMLSSEVSIIILVFMSFERFMLIAVPFGGHQNLTWRTSCSSLAVIWIFGLTVALFPIFHWRNSTRFYGANALCFPLHLDDPYFAGWQYSAFVFIGINLLGILVITFLYFGMFWSIWRTRHATTLKVGDFEFAIRFFFIVFTNAVCWTPVIVLKIMAFYRIYITADVYSWISVFVIPVNSAFNPLLYTLTTPKYRELIRFTFKRRLKPFTGMKHQISNEDTDLQTFSQKNKIVYYTVSVLSAASKNNSFDLQTYNISTDRTSSTGCGDFCSSQSTGQGSRGNSFDMPLASFDHSLSEKTVNSINCVDVSSSCFPIWCSAIIRPEKKVGVPLMK